MSQYDLYMKFNELQIGFKNQWFVGYGLSILLITLRYAVLTNRRALDN